MASIAAALASAGCGADERATSGAAPPLEQAQIATSRLSGGNPPRADIVLLSASGRQLQNIPNRRPSGGLHRESPAWSPDGRRLAFTEASEISGDLGIGATSEIHVVNADGSGRRRLAGAGAFSPAWSPDGQTIAFARLDPSPRRPFPVPQTAAIWVIDSVGGHARRLTHVAPGRMDIPGSWSPDGRRLAFTRWLRSPVIGRQGKLNAPRAVYVIGADGSGERALARAADAPAYSPEGTRIAFASYRDENGELCYGDICRVSQELYLMREDGTGQRRLTRSRANEDNPSWSPDGARLAYQQGVVFGNAEAFSVFAANADGSCPTRIAGSNATWFRMPAWRPGSAPGRLRCR